MSKKNISFDEMIRQRPLSDFTNQEGQELSVICPICNEYFIAKVNRKGVVKCVVCENYVDL